MTFKAVLVLLIFQLSIGFLNEIQRLPTLRSEKKTLHGRLNSKFPGIRKPISSKHSLKPNRLQKVAKDQISFAKFLPNFDNEVDSSVYAQHLYRELGVDSNAELLEIMEKANALRRMYNSTDKNATYDQVISQIILLRMQQQVDNAKLFKKMDESSSTMTTAFGGRFESFRNRIVVVSNQALGGITSLWQVSNVTYILKRLPLVPVPALLQLFGGKRFSTSKVVFLVVGLGMFGVFDKGRTMKEDSAATQQEILLIGGLATLGVLTGVSIYLTLSNLLMTVRFSSWDQALFTTSLSFATLLQCSLFSIYNYINQKKRVRGEKATLGGSLKQDPMIDGMPSLTSMKNMQIPQALAPFMGNRTLDDILHPNVLEDDKDTDNDDTSDELAGLQDYLEKKAAEMEGEPEGEGEEERKGKAVLDEEMGEEFPEMATDDYFKTEANSDNDSEWS